ncbi:hypothetical protein HU200_059038 [Digitaria exilis]|uniref:Uncharacterized protein n=1 Tax=Digitaria exilis TaxID=1010633 RepID=A0A835AGL0_9POAL|nr:hypothetical protein HU200_059038 [Digitaria exilis]
MEACRKAVSYTLLGPPSQSLRAAAARAAEAAAKAAAAVPTTGDARRLLRRRRPAPKKARTENNSPTFASSGDPCLDFFFHFVPGTPAASVASLLAAAWASEPATALRLACNLRGVRGTGKSDREGFYTAALWIHGCHPTTLALNAGPVAEFGYLKDLPELLHRIIHGGVSMRTPGKKARLAALGGGGGFVHRFSHHHHRHLRDQPRRKGNAPRCAETREARIAAANARDQIASAEAAVERRKKRAEAAARAVDRYARDPNYRLLHDCTAELFAKLLADDMEKLAGGKVNELSLAAKWCPSLTSSYDRSTLMCEAIARRLFPKGSAPDLADEHYAYRVRERLRKAHSPLRRALMVPEIFVSAKAWGDVVYKRVASVAMKNYKGLFLKHDADRFGSYLADVKSGKAKIAAGALLPHEILASIGTDAGDDGVADLQWQRMVSDLRALGKLSNCIAVCDVSGSMEGEPMDVCVALGLLVSELSDEPWHHRVITFSKNPQLHVIAGETLEEKANFIRCMNWAMNTDFQAKCSTSSSTSRVFVFSDMEFDLASTRPWETDYEAITRKFTEAGYGASNAVPVTASEKGVALVSGFSKNMVKLFLDGGGIVTPRDLMEKAISGPEYQKLVVFD